MKVRHPQYGVGVVRSLAEQTAEIVFEDAPRTIAPASSDLQPADATATVSELEMPLANLIRDTAHAVVERQFKTKGCGCRRFAARWQREPAMQSADSSSAERSPAETFFHPSLIRTTCEPRAESERERQTAMRTSSTCNSIYACYGRHHVQHPVKNKDDQFRTAAKITHPCCAEHDQLQKG
jgi:hypothetical protein